MATQNSDQPEFSDSALRDGLQRVGRTARLATFRSGLPIVIYKDKQLVRVYENGRQIVLSLDPHADVAGSFR